MFVSGQLFAHVITVCDEASAEKCPIFAGPATRMHWSFPILRGARHETAKLEQVRIIRDEIRARIEQWCDGLPANGGDVERDGENSRLNVSGPSRRVRGEARSSLTKPPVEASLMWGCADVRPDVLAMIYTLEIFPARILILRLQLAFGGAPIPIARGFTYLVSQCAGAFLASIVFAITFPVTGTLSDSYRSATPIAFWN